MLLTRSASPRFELHVKDVNRLLKDESYGSFYFDLNELDQVWEAFYFDLTGNYFAHSVEMPSF
jgi:hypothetical protein